MISINNLVTNTLTIGGSSAPSGHDTTWIKFSANDTWHEYDIKGDMDYEALIAAGLMPEGSGTEFEPVWTSQPYAIEIGNTVTSIGNSAFHNCSGLTSITIGDNVESIGTGAFRECTSLTSVTIPNIVTSIEEQTFYGCSSLTNVTIGDNVTSIEDDAFCGCNGLTSITIGNSVTSIGGGAFYGCRGLASVTIPNSVTSIGYSAFYNCIGLTSVTIDKSKSQVESMGYFDWGLGAGHNPETWEDIIFQVTIHCNDNQDIVINS